MPDFKTHKKFIENNPYIHWYLFSLNGKFIGTFYIKDDNSIGINTNFPNFELFLTSSKNNLGVEEIFYDSFIKSVNKNKNLIKENISLSDNESDTIKKKSWCYIL